MKFKELMENKLFKMLAIIIGVVLFIIVIVLLFVLLTGGRVSSYSQLEDKLITAAKNYYTDNADKLPATVGTKVEIDSTTLANEKYMKSMEKIQPKNATCTGRVVVKNVNQGYFYQAFVNCGENYNTTTLSSYIETHENIVSIGDGLYNINGNKIYRGENPKNYISFAGRIYRIVEINNDGTIDIIATEKADRTTWDDRYNQDRNTNDGINDYAVSRIKDNLLTFVNSESFTDSDRNKLEPHTLCIGKVGASDVISLKMECSNTLENQIAGLLPISYYVTASLDANCKTISDGTCQNYNYLQTDYNWWTLTADSQTTHKTISIQANGSAYLSRSASTSAVREVLRLTENITYKSGTGTSSDPYVIK